MDIKDKVRKLLALSSSPNEHEAKAALLKARELMAKNKLDESDIGPAKAEKLIHSCIGITYTAFKGKWKNPLIAVISEKHGCKSFVRHVYRSKSYELGLIGIEDDFNLCETIVKYAVDCIESETELMRIEYKEIYYPKYIEKLVNAYALGFIEGLREAYKEQEAAHQEYSLVLNTPQAVLDEASILARPKKDMTFDTEGREAKIKSYRGYMDGLNFKPEKRLAN